jgi:hypothetical protein
MNITRSFGISIHDQFSFTCQRLNVAFLTTDSITLVKDDGSFWGKISSPQNESSKSGLYTKNDVLLEVIFRYSEADPIRLIHTSIILDIRTAAALSYLCRHFMVAMNTSQSPATPLHPSAYVSTVQRVL